MKRRCGLASEAAPDRGTKHRMDCREISMMKPEKTLSEALIMLRCCLRYPPARSRKFR